MSDKNDEVQSLLNTIDELLEDNAALKIKSDALVDALVKLMRTDLSFMSVYPIRDVLDVQKALRALAPEKWDALEAQFILDEKNWKGNNNGDH